MTSSSPAPVVVAQSRPKRHWQMLPPKMIDPGQSLAAFLGDWKYMEWAFLDHAHDGDGRKEPDVLKTLSHSFELSEAEKDFLQTPTLEPGQDEDTLEAWTLRLNGRALSFSWALRLAGGGEDFDVAQWLRGVRQLNQVYGEGSNRVLAKHAEAKQLGGAGLEAFEAAWVRLRKAHEKVEPEYERLTSVATGVAIKHEDEEKERAKKKARAAKVVAVKQVDEEAKGIRGFVNKYQLLFMAAAAVLVVVTVGWVLLSVGLFTDVNNVKEIKVDLSGTGLQVESVITDSVAMVAIISGQKWAQLTPGQKEEKVKELFSIAAGHGLEQVQIRSKDDRVFAQAWSRDRISVLE